MIKDLENKAMAHETKGAGHKTLTPLERAIAAHEQALADAQAREARAENALQEFRAAELRALQAQRRQGQAGFYLQPDARREELERAAVAARAESMRLDTRLQELRRLHANQA